MDVSITQFRKNIFALMNQAIDGAEIWVVHKGSRFQIVPEKKSGSKLSRLTPLQIINAEPLELTTQEKEDMRRAWEADWSTL